MPLRNEAIFATQPAAHYNHRYHKPIWYAPNKFEAYGEEEIKAVEECLRDGWLVCCAERAPVKFIHLARVCGAQAPGKRTLAFEQMVAEHFGKKEGIFCNSGSSGNVLALKIAGLKEGDEVITPACTFSTTGIACAPHSLTLI